MASNFAGVRGADDSRNDIIVRGNTPLGVVYRMEGIDIPNPNHFSMIGMTGGPVSILNNKVLSNSDFFTGAFPAEYGNGIAAVFDLNLRNGNNEKYEFTGQLSTLGAEALIEGPISKTNRSSFIANYRYSTIALMEILGIDFGIAALPRYSDASFKLNFPGKNGSNVSVYGVGGYSDITIANSTRDTSDIFDTQIGKDIRFGSRMGIVGANYTKLLNDKSWIKASVYTSINHTYTEHDTINDLNLPTEQQVPGLHMRMKYHNWRIGTAVMFNHKFSPRLALRTGFHFDRINAMGIDSSRYLSPDAYRLRADYNENTAFSRAYAQFKYKITTELTMNAGLHTQMFFLNNSVALEPRFGLRYALGERHALNFGYGLHHQLQPMHLYFQQMPNARNGVFAQQDVDFTRSHHLVTGWDWRIGKQLRAKTEVYWQGLSRVPVEVTPSAFSMINLGANFILIRPDTLVVNEGTGSNYGAEFTLEKFFSKGYFFLATASLYESKYAGSDGVERDTDFNSNYGLNLLAGKEFPLGKKKNTRLGLSANFTYSGGRRFSPIDWDESRRQEDYIG
ncbi:MAG: TonB-dependent receptor, partial [Bacteroidota bacterium]